MYSTFFVHYYMCINHLKESYQIQNPLRKLNKRWIKHAYVYVYRVRQKSDSLFSYPGNASIAFKWRNTFSVNSNLPSSVIKFCVRRGESKRATNKINIKISKGKVCFVIHRSKSYAKTKILI